MFGLSKLYQQFKAKGSVKEHEMEPPDVVTDAGVFNRPKYLNNNSCKVANGIPVSSEERNCHQEVLNDEDTSTPLNSEPSYDMTGKKYLIIFNHYKYKKWRNNEFHRPSIRKGTFKDVASLEQTFGRCGFEIIFHNDRTHKKIMKYLKLFCKKDHSETSCVAVAVMTHGYDSCLYAADTLYPVTDITDTIQATRSLTNKPKLFFIQACRAGHIGPQTQENKKGAYHEMGSDCLILFSTYEDHYSYRGETSGSWMMQALCREIDANRATMHFVKIITPINGRVTEKKTKDDKSDHYYKQTPVTKYNMKKFLWL